MARVKKVDGAVKKSKTAVNKISKLTTLYGITPYTPEDIAKEIIRNKVLQEVLRRAAEGLVALQDVKPYTDYLTELRFQEIKEKVPLAPSTFELNKMTPEERFRATYPAGNFDSLDEALAYQGYIVPFFNGNKGIFKSVVSKGFAKTSVSDELLGLYAYIGEFISVNGGTINDWNKVILFLDKPYQLVYFARVYKTDISSRKASFLDSRLSINGFGFLATQPLLKSGVDYIGLLKEVIPDDYYINNVSVVKQESFAINVNDGFDAIHSIDFAFKRANFGNDVVVYNSDVLRANWLNNSVNITPVKFIYASTRFLSETTDVRIVDTDVYFASVLKNSRLSIESLEEGKISILSNSRYLFSEYEVKKIKEFISPYTKHYSNQAVGSKVVNNSKTLQEQQGVISGVNIFEDDTGSVEQADFLATPKVRDNDLYRHNLGGGADYYSGINLAGWDTLANNPTSSTVTYNRSREVQKTPSPAKKNSLETFTLFSAPARANMLTVGSLGRLRQPKLVSKDKSSFALKNIASVSQVSPSAFSELELIREVSLDDKIVFIRTDNPNVDVYAYKPIFVRPNSYRDVFSYKPVFMNRETPINAKNDYSYLFIQQDTLERRLAYPAAGAFSSSRIQYNVEHSLAETKDSSSSLIDFEDTIAKIFQKDSSVLNVPADRYVYPIYIDSSLDEFKLTVSQIDNIDSSLSSFYLNETFDTDEDEWEPTGTWSDIKGQPYSYLITLQKYPVDNGIYKLFLDKPISYIDIWKYVDYGNNETNIWENVKGSGVSIPPHKSIDYLTEYAYKAFNWKYKKPVKHQSTLMQIGYGYTSSPNVTIDAAKLKPEIRESVLTIPSFLTWDISSDQVFDSPQIDTRDYYGSIVLRAKAELRPFKEWIESVGEVFAFIYGVTLMYHFTTPMCFENQSFLGCSAKGLKIIGEMPKISFPNP